MIWRESNGSWNALTLAKGIFPVKGSASVSAERDDGDCVPPLRKIVFCPVNLDDDNGCKSCDGDNAHTHWLRLDLEFHLKE